VILVDSSVWIEHLRHNLAGLSALLAARVVLCHPFVIGELACGSVAKRRVLLGALSQLPSAPLVAHDEVLGLVERRQLAGRGIGWVDAHLLASAMLAGRVSLWTRDKRLSAVANDLGLAYVPARA
jgi:predicted nucleic acid-binding protein